ncbi:MAG: ornithine cyclodeaminase family protein, partial [Candidatus Limnocylindrales bacterium]
MTTTVRYLSAADVSAAMPTIAERLVLAERTLTALVADAELPAKIGVHPRPPGSFAHAMPASLRPRDDATGATDLLGIKWVTGVPSNRGHDLPAIHAVVVMSDPATGEPKAILDGGPITAERTAAVSGVAIARFGPTALGRSPRAAIIGAGVQGYSHVAVLGHVLPGVELVIS